MKKQKLKDGGTPSRNRPQHLSNCGGLEERDDGRSRVRVIFALSRLTEKWSEFTV